jgi:GNAT superfamily N-acetyltransferase
MLDGSYYAATDEQGTLVGFFCFGAPAQVPGGQLCGLYADDALDIGLGVRPDLTGRRLGREFLTAGLDFARRRFAPAPFRLAAVAGMHAHHAVLERVEHLQRVLTGLRSRGDPAPRDPRVCPRPRSRA